MSQCDVWIQLDGFFRSAEGISIIAGRAISPSDTASSLKVAVVNQTLARHLFPRGNAIGRSLTIGIDSVKGPWQEFMSSDSLRAFGRTFCGSDEPDKRSPLNLKGWHLRRNGIRSFQSDPRLGPLKDICHDHPDDRPAENTT